MTARVPFLKMTGKEANYRVSLLFSRAGGEIKPSSTCLLPDVIQHPPLLCNVSGLLLMFIYFV